MRGIARGSTLRVVAVLFLVAAAGLAGCERAPADSSANTAPAAATCELHGVARCPLCNPGLLESMGFCTEHDVPEAVCTRCRDDLEAAFRAAGDWCGGHGLPESQCEACNPGTLARFDRYRPARTSADSARPDPELAVVTDDTPRARRPPALACDTDVSLIRFTDPAVAQRAGLVTEPVRQATLRQTLEAPATVEYDARRYARLAPRAAGTVVEVRHDVGAEVAAGDTLVVLDCDALGEAKAELLQAAVRVALWQQNHARERGLLEQSLSTQREALETETQLAESRIALGAARRRLTNLGLTSEEIDAVEQSQDTSSLLAVRAPFPGTVVELDAVIGERAAEFGPLVSVADTSRMWVILDVDQADVPDVVIDRPVLLTAEGRPGELLGGRVTWVSSQVDARTRTVKVRAEFANPTGALRARSFLSARVVTRDDELAVLVPKAAVQWEGCCNVAFEQRSPTEYVPRKLRLGYDAGDHYEVLEGLSGGETVVTEGSFLLKTELQKGSIGAGCCEVDHLDR